MNAKNQVSPSKKKKILEVEKKEGKKGKKKENPETLIIS